MNGKIRVSIVATSLRGSNINIDTKPILNIVNSSGNNNSYSDNLFSKNNAEQNIANSIDGATALKLDENYEIKNSEEQNVIIDSYESNEENKFVKQSINYSEEKNEIPSGVSIESASYMENKVDINVQDNSNSEKYQTRENTEEEYTPKLFSEDQSQHNLDNEVTLDEKKEEKLFDQDTNEDEDFEIPAFLRRQKF